LKEQAWLFRVGDEMLPTYVGIITNYEIRITLKSNAHPKISKKRSYSSAAKPLFNLLAVGNIMFPSLTSWYNGK